MAPRIMVIGPAPASKKLMAPWAQAGRLRPDRAQRAFATQSLATLRDPGFADDDIRGNPNGSAIALGHPLGISGARISGTAANELTLTGGRHSLSAMCISIAQGTVIALEQV